MGRMIQLSYHSSACLAYFHREHSDNQRAGEARPHLFQQKHRCLRLVSHHLSILLCSPLWLYHTSQCYQYGVCMITDSIVVMIIIEEELEDVW